MSTPSNTSEATPQKASVIASSSRRWAQPTSPPMRDHSPPSAPEAIDELKRVLESPTGFRTAVLRVLTARPAYADLATLIAMADTDEVVRLRVLRAIRDVGVASSLLPMAFLLERGDAR